jgi:hypothetical protein
VSETKTAVVARGECCSVEASCPGMKMALDGAGERQIGFHWAVLMVEDGVHHGASRVPVPEAQQGEGGRHPDQPLPVVRGGSPSGGGRAMSETKHSPIDMMLDGAEWVAAPPREPDPGGLPHVTHSGVLNLPGFGSFRVYRLSDGRAIVDAVDFAAFLETLEVQP